MLQLSGDKTFPSPNFVFSRLRALPAPLCLTHRKNGIPDLALAAFDEACHSSQILRDAAPQNTFLLIGILLTTEGPVLIPPSSRSSP